MWPKLGALCWRGSARVAVGVSSVCSFGRLQVGHTRFPVLRRGGGVLPVDAEESPGFLPCVQPVVEFWGLPVCLVPVALPVWLYLVAGLGVWGWLR
jgi:hypothetical protein